MNFKTGGSSCKDFDVRLIEGESEREGRVEICYNGVWGTVCADYGWDEVDVNIVCQQLGFSYQGTTSISNNQFGALILLGNVACNQNHSNLSQCVDLRSIGSYHDCEHTAGVICMDEDILVTNTQIQPTIFYASTTYTSHGSTYKSHDSNSTASVGSDSSTIALFGTGGALVIVIAIAVTEMVLIAMLMLRKKKVNW